MKVILKESLCAIFDPHLLRCFKFSQDKERQAMKFSGWWISGHSRRIRRKFLKCGLMPPKNIQISDKNSYKSSRKICFLPILKPSKLARAIWVGHLILYIIWPMHENFPSHASWLFPRKLSIHFSKNFQVAWH